MKIAVLSDIHANNAAFESVIQEMERCQIEKLLVLGDIVGYYYNPDLIMNWLDNWPKEMIQGNHEQLLGIAIGNTEVRKSIVDKYGSGIEMALSKLSTEHIHVLTNLPVCKSLCIDGIQIEMFHGSPWDRNAYVYPDSEVGILERCYVAGADFVFMGHTHYPFVRNIKNSIIANPGSVGQSRDKGGVASWIILDTYNKSLVFKSTPYNYSSVLAEARKYDPSHDYLQKVLMR
jgi:putative phosphoesterase